MGTRHGDRIRVAGTLDPELYEWFTGRIEMDRSLRNFSHAIELGLELLRADLERRDRELEKRGRR